MAQVIYLCPEEPDPPYVEDIPWLRVEPFDNDGKFYGSGGSRTPSGEWVGYVSIAENDVSLEKALTAALEWAETHGVPVIHVRTEVARQRHAMWGERYHRHIEWKPVLTVLATPPPPDLPNSASFSNIDFYVEGYRLSLTATADTDEIEVAVSPAKFVPLTDPATHPLLLGVIGRTLGWFWKATNSQGYADMLILAVSGEEIGAGVSPQIAFLVEGATIQLSQIVPASACADNTGP